MGMVLSFRPRTKRVSRPSVVAAAPPAVVIFPGVRYERLSPGEIAAGKARRNELTTQPTTPGRS
jgi:hypothetical protein